MGGFLGEIWGVCEMLERGNVSCKLVKIGPAIGEMIRRMECTTSLVARKLGRSVNETL